MPTIQPPEVTSDSLPADLQAAQNGATYLAGVAGKICTLMSALQNKQISGDHATDKLIVKMLTSAAEKQPTCTAAIQAVVTELRATRKRNKPARFGEIVAATAHEAAIKLDHEITQAIWCAASPVEWALLMSKGVLVPNSSERMDPKRIIENFERVREHFATKAWPDANEIIIAVQLEAAKAAEKRQAPRERPKASGEGTKEDFVTLLSELERLRQFFTTNLNDKNIERDPRLTKDITINVEGDDRKTLLLERDTQIEFLAGKTSLSFPDVKEGNDGFYEFFGFCRVPYVSGYAVKPGGERGDLQDTFFLTPAWEDAFGRFTAIVKLHAKIASKPTAGGGKPPGNEGKKTKKSTHKGEARAKIIPVLTAHHKYSGDTCLNHEPIGNNELARQAEVSISSVSGFFDKYFEGHDHYKAVCHRNFKKILNVLKALNGDFSVDAPYGETPPEPEGK